MKRSFLLVFLLWISIGGGVIAQNRSIRFEPKDWKKAVEKARKENKLIFLDCHTIPGAGLVKIWLPTFLPKML